MRVVETESGRGGPSGLDLGSLLGRAPWQLQSGAQAALPPPTLAEAIARRLPFHDVELEAKTDKARALRLSGAPLYSASGRYCGYAGVASLLTDSALSADRAAELQGRIRQLEADNLARVQRHELAVRELDSFAYSVSHDLRAPLRVIDGFAQIVLEDYGERLDALGREHVKRILAAAGRMNSMIETLLAMSRMTGRELQFERVDLSETARQLAEAWKATARCCAWCCKTCSATRSSSPPRHPRRGSSSAAGPTAITLSSCATTAPVSTCALPTACSGRSSGCTHRASSRAPASAWRPFSASYGGTAAASGPSPSPARAPRSSSRCGTGRLAARNRIEAVGGLDHAGGERFDAAALAARLFAQRLQRPRLVQAQPLHQDPDRDRFEIGRA